MPKGGKKTLVRSGARLELAKAMYGEIGKGKEREREFDSAALASAVLQPSGLSSKLTSSELEGTLVSALLEDYLELMAEPLVAGTALQSNFEQCGRQMAHLDENGQVLCAAIVAVMARSSNHPLVVGLGAPALASLAHLAREGRDLSEFGNKREACKVLTGKAIQLADKNGTFRKTPTLSAVAALMLLETLVEPHSLGSKTLISRPYASAYTAHIRLMLETDDPQLHPFTPGSVVGHTAMVRDSLASALHGRSPSFSEDNLLQLRAGDESRSIPLSLVIAVPRFEDTATSLWFLFDSFLYHLSQTASLAARKLTSLKARRAQQLDLHFCSDFLDRLNVCYTATGELLGRVKLYLESALIDPSVPSRDSDFRYLYRKGFLLAFLSTHWLKLDLVDLNRARSALRAARCLQVFILDKVVRQRMETLRAQRNTIQPATIFEVGIGTENSVDEYDLQLKEFMILCHAAAFQAAKELVDILEDALARGEQIGGPGWLDSQGQEHIFTSLPEWASLLVETNAEEEGGPSGFDFATKFANLVSIKHAVCAVGWAFPHFSDPLAWLQEAIERVEEAQKTYWAGLAQPLEEVFAAPMSWKESGLESMIDLTGIAFTMD